MSSPLVKVKYLHDFMTQSGEASSHVSRWPKIWKISIRNYISSVKETQQLFSCVKKNMKSNEEAIPWLI